MNRSAQRFWRASFARTPGYDSCSSVLGGAISRIAPDATAYAHRKSAIMMIIGRASGR